MTLMNKNGLLPVFIAGAVLSAVASFADNGEAHVAKYRNGVPGDKTIEAAKKLNIKIPVMCREWHVWWGAPHGSYPHMPKWVHWKGQRIFGKFDWNTTIEQTRPGSQWRRWLNCVGYPLLGPYDSNQPDIIRWQLETAKNAGLECLHLQLWPSIWDEGKDFSPMPIFDIIMETAAKLKFPVALHDEIQFRRPPITKAQDVKNSITRSIMLLKRYGKHPGWYKINGMPVYYFQNWSRWIKPKDLATYLKKVEDEVGPVYWIVEMADNAEYFKIPQIKAIVSHSNGWFLHTPPFGAKPHPWAKLEVSMKRAAKLARKYGKKFGVQIKNRFNHTHDRGKPEKPLILPAEDGMFMVKSFISSMKCKPDFVVMAQWNDFEECAFIEPGWGFDGFNGDPYRFCRITAALVGKKFVPAKLPKRSELDPFIRQKLFGDMKKGDMGPVFQKTEVKGKNFSVKWAKQAQPDKLRFVQQELALWRPGLSEFNSDKLRLANYSAITKQGMIKGKDELRFYAPGLLAESPQKMWMGIRVYKTPKTKLVVNYRGIQENYRIDSRWERTHVDFRNGYIYEMPDKTVYYWTPLYKAQFAGREGDLLLHLSGSREKTYIQEIVIWSPDMSGADVKPDSSVRLPGSVNTSSPFIAVAYDKVGNAGPPRLILPATARAAAGTEKKLGGYDLAESFLNLKQVKQLAGGKPNLIKFSPNNPDVPYMALTNSVVSCVLPKPLYSLSLKIDMQQSKYCRGQWVALFDKSGKKGVGFLWDSSLAKAFNGNGFIRLVKFDLKEKPKVNSKKISFSKSYESKTKVGSLDMLKVVLDVTPGEITVKFNGQVVKAKNPVKGPYTQVIIRGNETGYFDNLLVKGK